MRWLDGQVSVVDSVAMPGSVPGRVLRDTFIADIPVLTLGVIRVRDSSLYLGPIELLRFGRARLTRNRVEWRIDGGVLARRAGGRLRTESTGGRLVTSVEGYRPLLPKVLYRVTQLPIHRVMTRLHLLRVRGRDPAAGIPATSSDRRRAGVVDAALCLALARLSGRRPRVRVLLGIAAGYHIACWSLSGRTLGGLVMRQRVVAVDGSRPSVGQAVIRFLALPISLVRNRPDHDEMAGTEVIAD
jgi:RDD family protein